MGCGKACQWVALPSEGVVHTWTTCHYGSQEFLKETPYHLILVQFPGVETLFLSQLKKANEVKIGMKVQAQYKSKPELKASDIYFIPA
jgi:uncharacterized OB-fold protein